MNLAIKAVTQANLAEVVAEKRGQGATIASHEDVARIATANQPEAKPASVIVATGAETVGTVIEPQGEPRKAEKAEEKDDKENPFAKRISQLTKEKRELEEFAEGEYNARLSFQRRIEELEKQSQATRPEPKVEEDPEPNPEKYADQKLFLRDWGEWNRKKAVNDFQAAEAKRRADEEAARLTAELNERSQASVAAARKEYPDFDERLKRSPYPWAKLPDYFRSTLMESEYGAHVLYSLLEKPEALKKVLELRPGAAVLELGKLVAKFSDKPVEPTKEAKAETPAVIPTSRAPAPMPPLTSSGEIPITWDPAKPQPFTEYKRRKLDENRRKRGH